MQRSPVSISLSSYGADLVREHGQAHFIPLVAAAGASWIEWREELLSDENPAQLAQSAEQHGLESVFSSPLELWQAERREPNQELAATLQRARAFGARDLKVSLGHFNAHHDLHSLGRLLAAQPVRLLVENDQTDHGGRIEPFQHFFSAVQGLDLPLRMTFDIGNWQWQAQSALDAARLLGRHVAYVHCKAVRLRTDGKRVAIAPDAPELRQWEHLLRHMTQGITRAVEYPLQGADLLALTSEQVKLLAHLGQSRLEPAHV
ncbi:AP endonuclease [Pseudomonas sp. TKO26]|uniref:sugar phosphate isomerase/epimerase family protein n=1 Tax=unclassified Pseudomonas TaxID=196821 RepID=UPI000D98856F|nr:MULTISPECIES: TIM barrel protein [unclassified Pseudomonas]PYY88667.1 AP endonuclease [Pseudomonas sp. TKO30]PYY91528.1 AP endonuclease [Pseudomonas sp. TKO29]PYY94182.1 AP endonuclease [Pseudomonas sp. TKO26]PYZ00897.1 AP endonuclease [Pseudomonas sp. TKO14]